LAYKCPLASCCKSAKSWCRACSLVVMNMTLCEVEEPPDTNCESCSICICNGKNFVFWVVVSFLLIWVTLSIIRIVSEKIRLFGSFLFSLLRVL
jgi:hypothetical protein